MGHTWAGYFLGNKGKLIFLNDGRINKEKNNTILMQIKNMIGYYYI